MIEVTKRELERLREYAQWRDSIDALKLIDELLRRERDYIDEHPATRGDGSRHEH